MVSPELKAHLEAIKQRRIGRDGYCRLLVTLRTPMTREELAAHLGVHPVTLIYALRHLLTAGLIHRTQWHRSGLRGSNYQCRYVVGSEGDEPHPLGTERITRRIDTRDNLRSIAVALEILSERAMSAAELAEEMGVVSDTARALIKQLLAHKLIHVSGWRVVPKTKQMALYSACLTAVKANVKRPRIKRITARSLPAASVFGWAQQLRAA